MTAPAMGLVLRPVCRQTLQLHGLLASRAFASLPPKTVATGAAAQSAAARQQKQSSPPGARVVPVSSGVAKNPVLLQLARSPGPTLLYESASHFWMKLSAWSTVTLCYMGAGVNYYLTSAAAPGGDQLAWFIPPIYTATSLALAGMGSFYIMGTANIVKSVRAVPTALLQEKPPSTINPILTPVHLEVAIKPLLPFRTKSKILTVPPEKVMLSHALYHPSPSAKQARALEKQEKKEKKEQWEKDKQRLMTLPFRDAWRYTKIAFYGMKRALIGGGFVKMTVGDRKCKLDMTTGWALNEGKTLEALVMVDGATTARPPRR